jgi:hypothetical protein
VGMLADAMSRITTPVTRTGLDVFICITSGAAT